MDLSPFQDNSPEILPLDTEFEVPDWWQPTGTRWNSTRRKGGRDRDGQTETRYLKKFALLGSVESYKFGTVPVFQKGDSQPGLICSAGALFMVVECDNPAEWDNAITGDATPTVRSRRGFHYYFAIPEHLASYLPTDGPIQGGDVQTKGFVPAPGTIHPSGVRYELVSSKINIADEALLDRLRRARERVRVQHMEQYERNGGTGEWKGSGGVCGQDDYLAQVVTWNAVAAGGSEADVREIWMREAAALPLKDPEDPFGEDDFQRHYQGAVRAYGEREAQASDAAHVSQEVMTWAGNLGGTRAEVTVTAVLTQKFLPAGYTVPEKFNVEMGCVTREVKSGKSFIDVPITELPLYVSGIEIDSDDSTWFELTWKTHDGSKRKVTVPTTTVTKRGLLPEVFPEPVILAEHSGHASEFISRCRTVNAEWLAQEGRTRKVALRLGWYGRDAEDGFAAGPGRPFQVRDTANLGGWLQGHQAKGSLDEWVAAMYRMPPKVVMLTAAALSAPLLQILEVNGFVMDNSGATTQGKTKAARVAASAWGDPDRLLLSWSATRAALELYSTRANGVPLLIDDSKLVRDSEQVSSLIYQITSGLTTDRMERSADKLRGGGDIRTVLVTNGETPLLTAGKGVRRDGGAVARCLELWGRPFSTAEEADSVNLVIRENHGLAGEAFVQWMVATGAPELRSRYQELRHRVRSMVHTDVARRRADAGAIVMLCAQLAHTAKLLPPVADSEWATLLEDDAAEEGSDDQALAALEMVWRRVALEQRLFWESDSMINGISLMSSRDMPFGGWAGRLDRKEGWVAVSPEWIKKFLTEEGIEPEGIIRQWQQRQWISSDQKGRRQVVVRVAGRNIRCVKIVHGGEQMDEQESVTGNSSNDLH